ncbi:MAG TPA: helix-turn-helix transcriptional regulator [Clostridia bacterium]|nr:helix-turn-helix transcriptional regulator [Clostridia bacterium]
MGVDKQEALFEGLVQELRRGTIILSVMSRLKSPQYGYSLVILLAEKGIAVDAGTLYPLLRRLEGQGILESSWDVESAKPRKYYQLSEYGGELYRRLCAQWFELVDNMNNLIEDVE